MAVFAKTNGILNKKTLSGTDVMIFKNIFAEKFCLTIGVFDSTRS
jgi:hypothetical protein